MRKLLILGIPLLLTKAGAGVFTFFDPLNSDKSTAASANIEAFVADDPVSLGDLLDKWHGEFHPKSGINLAVDDMRVDIGGSSKKWGYLGYTYRHQSFTAASSDTVELAWQQLNDIGFTPGRVYNLDISIEGFEADGIVYAKSFELLNSAERSLKIGVGIELLRGRNMQDGYLKGDAAANSSKDYDFSAVSDYRYTENYLYNLEVEKAEGFGYTTHLGLSFRHKNIALHLLANDIYSRIEWKRLPYSYVNVNSSNKSYDENGFIIYNPTVSGIEKYIDYSQKLYTKYRAEGNLMTTGKTTYIAGSDYVKGFWFPYAEISHLFENGIKTTVSYESRFKSVGIDIYYSGLHLILRSDDIDHPSALGLGLSYLMHF